MASKSAAEATENLSNLINNNKPQIDKNKLDLEATVGKLSINPTPETAIKYQIIPITRPLGPEIP